MTQDGQGTATGQTQAKPTPRRARRWLVGVTLVLIVVLVLPLAAGAALWLRLGTGPVTLPAALTAQITERIDAAMLANTITIGRIQISRAAGDGGLDMTIRDLAMTDPDGAIRAAFPALVVNLSGEALLQGDVAPVRVDLQGAGLRLARDATGQIDLALMAGGMASEIGLGDSLARLDRMLASPVFARLEAVNGRGLELVMADAMTGQTMRVSDARMRLERVDGALALRLGGALEGSRDATIDIALSRSAQNGTTQLAFSFDGLAARDIATIGPALVQGGLDKLAVHLFLMYWGMISFITPPVAIGAYAAASVAQSDPMKTGFEAMRLGSIIYFVPFFFVLNPALIGQGNIGEILLVLSTAMIGILLISAGLQGYLYFIGPIDGNPTFAMAGRVLLVVGGLILALPGNEKIIGFNHTQINLAAIAVSVVAIWLCRMGRRQGGTLASSG